MSELPDHFYKAPSSADRWSGSARTWWLPVIKWLFLKRVELPLNQRVRVVRGFYKGCQGTVKGPLEDTGLQTVRLDTEGPEYFKPSDLEKMDYA